jgi:LPS export ABC transporter protein LptC
MSGSERQKSLRRRKIVEYFLVVALVAMMVGLYFLGRAKDARLEKLSLRSDLELQGKFTVSRFEKGKLTFLLSGKDFQFFQDRGQAKLTNPELKINSEKEPVFVRGKTARYFQSEKRVDLEDGVEITYQGYLAATPALSYDIDHKICTSPEKIKVSGNGLEMEGEGYTFDLGAGQVEINSGVRGKFTKQDG